MDFKICPFINSRCTANQCMSYRKIDNILVGELVGEYNFGKCTLIPDCILMSRK